MHPNLKFGILKLLWLPCFFRTLALQSAFPLSLNQLKETGPAQFSVQTIIVEKLNHLNSVILLESCFIFNNKMNGKAIMNVFNTSFITFNTVEYLLCYMVVCSETFFCMISSPILFIP